MKVLVTGAAGFVGSHVFKRLQELDFEVQGIDNLSPYYSVEYKQRRLESLGIQLGTDLINCDISDYEQLQAMLSSFKPQYIIHLAAQAGVRLSLNDSNSYISANVEGFNNIVRAGVKNGINGILYASSSSVYGDSTPTPYKESSQTLRPKSIYGVTKLSNEIFAEIHSKSSGLSFRGLRYFTVYGPWGRPDMAYFRIAAAALGQGKFTLFGDGSIRRDFTYIDDVINKTIGLFQDLIKRERGFNDVVNVGGSRPLEMNYLLELISKISGTNLEILKAEESKLDSRKTMADNSYLKSILGELKFTNLEIGVENLMNWARKDEIKSNLLKWVQSTV
jgi:UDP-glucuronate 4-epimerase